MEGTDRQWQAPPPCRLLCCPASPLTPYAQSMSWRRTSPIKARSRLPKAYQVQAAGQCANHESRIVREIASVTTAVANGDLTQKVQAECRGEIFELKKTINSMVDQLQQFAREVTKIAREVGTEGRLGGQATVHDAECTWRDLTENVNNMAMNLTTQVRGIALVTTAVAKGDLTKKITVEVRGEILDLKNTINTMVDRLGTFAFEVSKVAREVGTDGTLGGQAQVDNVEGKWKDLTENVNTMASNLTSQVRAISPVTQAIANGDMSQKIDVEAMGEIFIRKETINNLGDRLSIFCNEVQRVAKDVGVDGIMGGQADVAGLKGRWKEITTDVNTLANNLVCFFCFFYLHLSKTDFILFRRQNSR